MALLYLIRHAKPQGAGTFLGQADPPLADGALDELGQALSALPVSAVYVSPLCRARETAAQIRCRNLTILPDLREIGFGEWTGKTWTEIEAHWPDLAGRKLKNWQQVTPPGGESWSDFEERIGRVWNCIREGPWPAAVVAHQAVNAVLAHLASDLPVAEFAQAYGEITQLTYVAD
jgi:broad specificity phosphatase PhoE